jgi:hypothetical protein
MEIASPRPQPEIRIDATHSRAICDEIGWRLRKALAADYATLPHALALLLKRFIDVDLATDAPSLAPVMSDLYAPLEYDLETANAWWQDQPSANVSSCKVLGPVNVQS